MTWVMATRFQGGKKSALTRLRNQAEASTQRKTVNSKLEAMLNRMLEEATKVDSSWTFDQKMELGSLVLKLEAVRNKLQDDDWGSGFLSDPTERSHPIDETIAAEGSIDE